MNSVDPMNFDSEALEGRFRVKPRDMSVSNTLQTRYFRSLRTKETFEYAVDVYSRLWALIRGWWPTCRVSGLSSTVSVPLLLPPPPSTPLPTFTPSHPPSSPPSPHKRLKLQGSLPIPFYRCQGRWHLYPRCLKKPRPPQSNLHHQYCHQVSNSQESFQRRHFPQK